MIRNGVQTGKLASILLVATLTLAGLLMIQPEDGKAALSSSVDEGGYMWVDSTGMEPRVGYDWIDAKANGVEFVDIDTSSEVAELYLEGFEFPYYGELFDELWVTAYGYICFDPITSPNTGYSSNLPNSNGQGGQIAVGWSSAYDYYTTGSVYGGVHYYFSPLDDWVCIEWNKNSVGQTFEVILYDTGLIKLQWKDLGTQDNYKNGYYLVAGVESPDESTGLCYSRYTETNLFNGLAVEFSTNMTVVERIALSNGHGDGHICYAEYGMYKFQSVITSSAGSPDLTVGAARVIFGNYMIPETLSPIGAEFRVVAGVDEIDLLPGSGQFISLKDFRIDVINLTHARMTVEVGFLFEFPQTGNISISVWARGKYSLPDYQLFDDVFYLDNKVTFEGSLAILGEKGREIMPREYTKENETLNVTGFKLAYEKGAPGIYPKNDSFYFILRDERNVQYVQRNTSGREVFFKVVMPLDAVKKTFTLILLGIPMKNFIGEMPEFWLLVDNTPPPEPLTMTIRADSRIDPQILVDNDETLYVTWSTVNDIGSGVAKYRVHSSYEPGDDSIPFVDSKTTTYVWEGTKEGVFTLAVWAEDYVGHAGPPVTRSITIDKSPPTFSEFSISEYTWIKTLTPEMTIYIKDDLSKGEEAATMVWAESIEYSVSTNGTDNFKEWISADVLENDFSIQVKIKPLFEEGSDNWIKFRAKDLAGNGPVESQMYNIWIDVTEVSFSNVFPTQNVWHTLQVVTTKEVEATLYDATSMIDPNLIYYRIAISKDEDGDPIWKTGIAQEGNWVKPVIKPTDKINGDDTMIRVHFKYTEFQEGEDNIIQFRTNDKARNGKTDGWTLSSYYSLKVNTKPTAVISQPENGQKFELSKLFTLDATGTKDIDVDRNNLEISWYVGDEFLGSGLILDNVKFDKKGVHYITLYVADSGHYLDAKTGIDTRANATVMVEITEKEYSPLVDTDGDGMDDKFEHEYLLNPYDPRDANIDYDKDGYTNLEEYVGTRDSPGPFNPREPTEYPTDPIIPPGPGSPEAPFSIMMFVAVIIIAVLIAAILVIVSFIRMNRREDREKREETEEEAMLVTPQLDIPTMPVMPMIDTSVPTLPAATPAEGQEALPPAPEEMQAGQPPIPSDNPFATPPTQ